MKKIIILTYLLIHSFFLSAQITFNTTINFSTNSEFGYSMLALPDSSFVVQGVYFDFEVNPGAVQGVYLMKVNAKGEQIWLKKYAYSDAHLYPGVNSLMTTKEGGFAFGGGYEDFTGQTDYMLWKLDAQGDSLWTKKYGGSGFESCSQARETADSGFVMIGRSRSFTDNPEEDADIYMVRTDKDGGAVREYTYGESGADYANTVEVMPDGGFLIGASIEKFIDGEKYDDGYLIRTNSEGSIVWDKRFGEDERHCILHVKPTNDRGFLIHSCRFLGDGEPSEWISNHYMFKADNLGNVIWSYHTPVSENKIVISSVKELEDGNIIFCGSHLNPSPEGFYWGVIGKLSADGELLWQKEYYTKIGDINLLYDIEPTLDGGFLASGTAYNPLDSLNQEGLNVWLLKVNCEGDLEHSEVCTDIDVGIGEEAFLQQNSLTLFPNPTQDQVQFTWNTPATQLSIYNTTGQLVEQIHLDLGQKVLQLEVADWERGIYFAVLEGKEGVLGREKMIIGN